MWVKKAQYEDLCRDSNTLELIISAVDDAENGKILVGEVVIMSNRIFNDIQAQRQADKDAVMKLTAERDWYKQKYAELIIAKEDDGHACH